MKLLIIVIILSAIFAICGLIYLIIIRYFLLFKLEKHPKLIKQINDVLIKICNDENIGVFYKTFDELNEGVNDENEKCYGKYLYLFDNEFQIKANNCLYDIRWLEKKYNSSYQEQCKSLGIPVNYSAEDFTYPRILLANDRNYDIIWFYSTFLHEIGHHFAVKELGKVHTEDDADKYAGIVMKKYLPLYFSLFYALSFRFCKLTIKEKIKGFFEYILFLINEKYERTKIYN